jgi:serine/threonine protein kinase
LQQLMSGASGGTGVMPNVTKYYASLMDGPKVWIVMEYAEGGSIRTLVSWVLTAKVYQLSLVVKSSASEGDTYLPHYARGSSGTSVLTQKWGYTSRY